MSIDRNTRTEIDQTLTVLLNVIYLPSHSILFAQLYFTGEKLKPLNNSNLE